MQDRKIDRTGIYVTGRIADELDGIIFREQLPGVTGLDAHFEILKNSYKYARVLGAKIYSDGFVCRGTVENLVYWFQHSVPVLILVHDPATDKIFWEHLREDNIILSPEEWELTVPDTQEFNENALEQILKIPSYSPHLSRLAVDRPWMEIIDGGKMRLLITAEENINRSATRGVLQLSITSHNGEKKEIFDWAFSSAPDIPFVYRFQELFPWAAITVDRTFYEMNSSIKDSDCEIRPWIVDAREIAHFRLELKLNDLGKAFLLGEKFIGKGEYPQRDFAEGFGSLYEGGLKFSCLKMQSK